MNDAKSNVKAPQSEDAVGAPSVFGAKTLRRTIALGISIGLLVVLVSGLLSYLLYKRAAQCADEATRLGSATIAVLHLSAAVVDAETGQRGYLLTGKDEYLQPYRSALENLSTLTRQVRTLLLNDPLESRIDAFQLSIGAKLAEMAQTIEQRRNGDVSGSVATVLSDRGKLLMDDLRTQANQVTEELIARRLSNIRGMKSYYQTAAVVVGGGTALLFSFLFLFGFLLSRQIALYERTDREIASLQKLQIATERTARSEAERMVRMQSDFVATLSHELRTPLNSVLGWAQILRKHAPAGTELESGLDTIERNARSQGQMIEDLLDTTRIASGKIRLDVQKVNPSQVIQAAVESIRPTAGSKGIRIETTLDPRTNLIHGDPSRLQQVIWNLVSNAVKFTPRGGKIQVSLRRVNSSLLIEVTDNGIGMESELLPHIFERFRQGDSGTSRSVGGLGLGLAIAKQLVELHGGAIWASSPGVDRGSTFTVQLPLLISQKSETAFQDQPVSPRAIPLGHVGVRLEGTKVLIVDDDQDSREVLQKIMNDAGAETLTASSARTAIASLPNFRPHVLISDIGMPEQDGYDFLRAVRALSPGEGGQTPAIALSALARSQDRTQALLAGFQVHAAKPIEPSEIIAQVAGLSGVRQSGAPARAGAGAPPSELDG